MQWLPNTEWSNSNRRAWQMDWWLWRERLRKGKFKDETRKIIAVIASLKTPNVSELIPRRADCCSLQACVSGRIVYRKSAIYWHLRRVCAAGSRHVSLYGFARAWQPQRSVVSHDTPLWSATQPARTANNWGHELGHSAAFHCLNLHRLVYSPSHIYASATTIKTIQECNV